MTEFVKDLIINFPMGKADECPIYYKNSKGSKTGNVNNMKRGNGRGLRQEKCAPFSTKIYLFCVMMDEFLCCQYYFRFYVINML